MVLWGTWGIGVLDHWQGLSLLTILPTPTADGREATKAGTWAEPWDSYPCRLVAHFVLSLVRVGGQGSRRTVAGRQDGWPGGELIVGGRRVHPVSASYCLI